MLENDVRSKYCEMNDVDSDNVPRLQKCYNWNGSWSSSCCSVRIWEVNPASNNSLLIGSRENSELPRQRNHFLTWGIRKAASTSQLCFEIPLVLLSHFLFLLLGQSQVASASPCIHTHSSYQISILKESDWQKYSIYREKTCTPPHIKY